MVSGRTFQRDLPELAQKDHPVRGLLHTLRFPFEEIPATVLKHEKMVFADCALSAEDHFDFSECFQLFPGYLSTPITVGSHRES